MKHETAVYNLRMLMLGLQKYRSTAMEAITPDSAEMADLAEGWPWIFGNKCPLEAMSKVLSRVDSGDTLTPMDYYNFVTVFTLFMPEVVLTTNLMLEQSKQNTVPEEPPDVQFISTLLASGWTDN